MKMRLLTVIATAAFALACAPIAHALEDVGPDLATEFACEVSPRLALPADEQRGYAELLRRTLSSEGLSALSPQYVVLVDRSASVQAAFIYLLGHGIDWAFIGASPVSTGRPGSVDHFLTPLGVFPHSLQNMDFRAEGTLNKNGIRGYGVKGMRVFDFGWIMGERGWGASGKSIMRLQMHATDPDFLEKRLGERASNGCIRISATLNHFIDRYGLIDADYEQVAQHGRLLWVLRGDRTPVATPGRYLVVVDTQRAALPAWARRP